MSRIIKFFYVFFAIIFLYLLINIPFREISTLYDINSLIFAPISIIIIFIWYFIYKVVNKKFNKLTNKKKIILICSTFIFIIIIEILIILFLDVPLGWDFEVVYQQAKSYVLNHAHLNSGGVPHYFQYFPNNIPIFIVLVIVFKFFQIFGMNDFLLVGEIFNAILILLTIIFTYLFIKKSYGEAKAYFSLLIFLFFIPLFLYIPVFYSDTFSILFVPLILYTSAFFNSSNKKYRIISYLCFGIFSFIGCKMKMTVIFIPLAIIFAQMLKANYKCFLILLSSLVLSFLVLGSFYNYFVLEKDIFYAKYDNYGAIPYTHWVMMGIEDGEVKDHNSYGGYNGDDYEKTESFKTGRDSMKYHIKEIKRRINKWGFIGYANYLTNKAVNAWGDGNYYAAIKLNWQNKYNANNFQKIISGSDNNHYMIYFNSSVSFAFLILLVMSFLWALIKKDNNLLVIQLSISMIFVFLLLWENRSRYLYNYIPIFNIVIVYYIDKLKLLGLRWKKYRG